MNLQTSILQEGSLRVDNNQSKNTGSDGRGKIASIYQYQKSGSGVTHSIGQAPSRGGAISAVQQTAAFSRVPTQLLPGTQQNMYTVQVSKAVNQESRSQVNQSSTANNNQNVSTIAGHIIQQRDEDGDGDLSDGQSFSQKFFGCMLNFRSFFCVCAQIIEKFFFFTLFLSVLSTAQFQIMIGVIFGVSSVLKFILFVYVISLDITTIPSTEDKLSGDHQSDDDSVESKKQRYCSKCELKVHIEAYHCDVCKKCVYHVNFHSKLLGICVAEFNKNLVEALALLSLSQSFLALTIGGLVLFKLLSDEDTFKEKAVGIFQQSASRVLFLITAIVLLIVLINTVFSSRFYWYLRDNGKYKKERPATANGLRNENLRGLALNQLQAASAAVGGGSVNTANGGGFTGESAVRGNNIRQQGSSLSATHRYHQPAFVQTFSGISQHDQRRFESHWKISPPDGRMDDNNHQIMSLNSSGTIFNFISKKNGSCENIDRLSAAPSPGKHSAKSFSSFDHSNALKQPNKHQKSMNFSDIDIVRNYSEKTMGMNNNSNNINKSASITSNNNNQNSLASLIPVQSSSFARGKAANNSSMKQSITSISKKHNLPPIQESLRQLNIADISHNFSVAPSRKHSDGQLDSADVQLSQ